MASTDHNEEPDYTFRKSSYSDGTSNCVEVATNLPGVIAIRDSTRPHDGLLKITPRQWHTLLHTITSDEPPR